MANNMIKKIVNGPGLIEMTISLAYAFRMDNLHLVDFTIHIPGLDAYKVRVMITAIDLSGENRDEITFSGRLIRFDGDISQKIEGKYSTRECSGEYTLIPSRLIVDVA